MSLEALLKRGQLPVRLRGYERASTDELLRAVENALAEPTAERDSLKSRLSDAEQELAQLREERRDVRAQAQAVARIAARELHSSVASVEAAAEREARSPRGVGGHPRKTLEAGSGAAWASSSYIILKNRTISDRALTPQPENGRLAPQPDRVRVEAV